MNEGGIGPKKINTYLGAFNLVNNRDLLITNTNEPSKKIFSKGYGVYQPAVGGAGAGGFYGVLGNGGITSDFTFMVLILTGTVNTAIDNIYGASNNGGGIIRLASDPHPSFVYKTTYISCVTGAGFACGAQSTTSFTINTWATLCSTFRKDGTGDQGGTHKLYLNGKLEGTNNFDLVGAYNGAAYGNPKNVYIGTESLVESSDINFIYVDVWNRVLSPSEVQSLYSAPYQFIQPSRRVIYSYVETVPPEPPAAVGVAGGSFLTLGVG